MGLSRLDNFLKNVRGEILYVDPSNLDSTDSVENQGNSLARPFKTIQRALIEAARFSYQRGLDNDRFGKTTILLYPGEHIVDNRPGWIPNGQNNFLLRNSDSSDNFPPFSGTTNFNINSDDNQLYKFNSVYGGIIIPRGTSIVGLDLRKTKIRPKYVPDPLNNNIERSAIFRLTGSSYIWQFTILDADPNSNIYKDYTTNLFVPNFSHHKLTVFEYADGVNNVKINDEFISNFTAGRTDLDIYYEKVGLAYGESSGRSISPDYPSNFIDIQTKVDEFRIVGSTGEETPISGIFAGDGIDSGNLITVTLSEPLSGLDVDTPIQIQNVDATGYNGQFVVSEVINSTTIRYRVQNPPLIPSPSLDAVANATLVLVSDTVTSASPYIFNISLRSVFGMCGLHADGSKANGFKSMVVAQFTGIGLQKDDNAFVLYNSQTGSYEDRNSVQNLYSNSRARYKPEFENFHIKASNDAFIQIVSVFAIGYANHFVAESGGDLSITNSNSNFGARSLVSSGFRSKAFRRDDYGYITHIIPPRESNEPEISIDFYQIDVSRTNSIGSTSRLYIYNENDQDSIPEHVFNGYRIGAKRDEKLFVNITKSGLTEKYSANIVMQGKISENSSEKISIVRKRLNGRSNSITNSIITLTSPHNFINGETVRVISDTGHLPDGLTNSSLYYVITNEVSTGIGSTQIKLAQSLNESLAGIETKINSNETSEIKIISRVSDKKPGDIGHPIQFDQNSQQWFINVSQTNNQIFQAISDFPVSASSRAYFTRNPDTRSFGDSIYRLRYVIPKGFLSARVPLDGYIIQESGTTTAETDEEIQKYLSIDNQELNSTYEIRNLRFISEAIWNNGIATISSEIPHKLSPGSKVLLKNVISLANLEGVDDFGFNGEFVVLSTPTRKKFTIAIPQNPGTFQNNISIRNTDLPYFTRKKYKDTYIIYRTQEIKKYIPGEQDGVYHFVVINSSNIPNITPFSDIKLTQPVQNLYPQINRDNFESDPLPSVSFASLSTIGEVLINDPQRSLTKETINKKIIDNGIGVDIANITSNPNRLNHKVFTRSDHGLNRITKVSIVNPGINYGTGIGASEVFYNAKLVGVGTTVVGSDATAIVRIDSSTGGLLEVKIIDGGSAYGIGNTLAVVGIATTTGHTLGIVSVTSIYNNVGDVISVSGITPDSLNEYNTVYRITNVSIGATTEFDVESANTIPISIPSSGIGATSSQNAYYALGFPAVRISDIEYNNSTGIAILTSIDPHGFYSNNKIRLGGASISFYNKSFIVKKVVSKTKFEINVGIQSITNPPAGTIFAYKELITSNGGAVTNKNENISGRLIPNYAGIFAVLSGDVLSGDIDFININNASELGFNIGDYLLINDEILRIRENIIGNDVPVFRGLLGTFKTTHALGAKVKKIDPIPVELRRNSIIRASGHTFEYLGFGPGNYSTSLPSRQDRKLSPTEEIVSASLKIDGGVAVYTAMNDEGAFFIGNKKINSATGQEEVFNAPIPTVTGEDLDIQGINIGFDVLSPLEVTISRSLKVEGGPDGNIISEFDSPVLFTNKITSTSQKGIEAVSLFLQGNQTTSKKYTVGVSIPSDIGSPGDVVFNSDPESGGYLGWVYTTNNEWEEFGSIKSGNVSVGIWSGTFVGDGSGLFNVSDIWRRDVSGIGIVTTSEVGIGTTLSINGVSLYVEGNTLISGITTFSNTTESLNVSSGSIVVKGGVGVEKSVNIGGDFSVVGVSSFSEIYVNTVSGITSFSNNVTFEKDVRINGLLSTEHLEVTGIATMRDNLYIRNQSIRTFVNGIGIIFGV
jgi:hypothetical protein